MKNEELKAIERLALFLYSQYAEDPTINLDHELIIAKSWVDAVNLFNNRPVANA